MEKIFKPSVFFMDKKKFLGLIFAFFAFLVIFLARLPESVTHSSLAVMDRNAQTTLAILAFALIMWMTEAIPFHITGLLSLVLFAVLGVGDFSKIVKEGFGNNIVIFFISVLILSAFISSSGLGKRILTFILSITGNSTRLILLAFLLVGMFSAMWITAMAVAAMMVPLAKEILEREKLKPLESNFGRALMISCAFGPVIGGISTPAGAGCNPLAIGFIKEMAGIELSFVDWMIYGVPCALLLILPCWLILLLFFPPELKRLTISSKELKDQFHKLPPMSHDEKITLILFLLTIILWLGTPLLVQWLKISIPVALPVCFTACLFFFPGMVTIPWKKIESQISWSGIILILSGISLGSMLYDTGAAKWIAVMILGGIGGLPAYFQILFVIMLTCVMKIAFSSNTVTATIIIPILIALAQQLGIPPLLIALPAAIASPLSLILVTSSPNNVIPYSTGYFSIGDMAKSGTVLSIIAAIILSATIYGIGKFQHIFL